VTKIGNVTVMADATTADHKSTRASQMAVGAVDTVMAASPEATGSTADEDFLRPLRVSRLVAVCLRRARRSGWSFLCSGWLHL
jgi:hypothetical protein